eukprot:6214621-Pleurochrysis_carterae.AAC.1
MTAASACRASARIQGDSGDSMQVLYDLLVRREAESAPIGRITCRVCPRRLPTHSPPAAPPPTAAGLPPP